MYCAGDPSTPLNSSPWLTKLQVALEMSLLQGGCHGDQGRSRSRLSTLALCFPSTHYFGLLKPPPFSPKVSTVCSPHWLRMFFAKCKSVTSLPSSKLFIPYYCVIFWLPLCPSCFPPSYFSFRSYFKCFCLREAFHAWHPLPQLLLQLGQVSLSYISVILPHFFHCTFSNNLTQVCLSVQNISPLRAGTVSSSLCSPCI